jgi:Virulence-associated protein E/Bifunctional DNA primase/polymerase, N-terminal
VDASGENTAANPLLLAALTYAKRGWQVLPCTPRDKRPATRHGFKDATTDKATLVRAWAAKPEANIGIATGAVSGIVVLDIDPRNGGDASLAELERVHGPLPETVSVATGGGGRHLYFAASEGALRSGDLADGVEVKADGRYVIAPPSVHPGGEEYRWVNSPDKTKLAPLPEWVRPRAKTKPAKPEQPIDAVPDAGATPLGRTFSALGMLGPRLDAGKRSVVCPWQDKHTTGTGSLQDSSTVIFPANAPDGLGGFYCFHAHCASRSVAEVLRELGRRSSAGSTERAWMSGLRRTPKDELKASLGNLVLMLTHDATYAGKLRLDEMRGVVMLGELEVTDATVSSIRVDFEKRYGIQPPDADTARAVQLVASSNAFHPVREFLSTLKWDGVPRLDQVAAKILRVRANSEEEAALLALLVRRWFICLVARVLVPGCKVDTALILEGAQGIGKSTFFRIIAGEWFSDTEMALDKDAMMQLRAAWIYEWAELENMLSRQSNSRVKAFLTSTEDKFRPPFGRTPVTVKRSGVIVGTTNDQDFLHDPSGSRRFWVVPVGAIDAVLLRAQRDQLLAEAMVAHAAGERRWLNEDEEARREALSTRFVETDPWEDRVLEFANTQERVRTADVLLQALQVPLEKLSRRDEMRVTGILKRARYRPEQSRVDGKTTRYWVNSRSGSGRDGRDHE